MFLQKYGSMWLIANKSFKIVRQKGYIGGACLQNLKMLMIWFA